MSSLVREIKRPFNVPPPTGITRNTLVERIMDAPVVRMGTFWCRSQSVDQRIFHDSTADAFFGVDISTSKAEARIFAQITVLDKENKQLQITTAKPNKSATPAFEISGFFNGIGNSLVFYLQPEVGKPQRFRQTEITRAIASIVDSYDLAAHLQDNGYRLENMITGLRVRGMLSASSETNERYTIRVDERNVAELCEDPSLIGRLLADRMIVVSVEVSGLIVPVTLVPDIGTGTSIKKRD